MGTPKYGVTVPRFVCDVSGDVGEKWVIKNLCKIMWLIRYTLEMYRMANLAAPDQLHNFKQVLKASIKFSASSSQAIDSLAAKPTNR